MLINIIIKDLAIVSSLDLNFSSGMSALTGETGAGKSILIDALGLILGNRADSGMIRATAKRAEITATFDISHRPKVQHWLEEQSLDNDDQLILRRVLHRTGSSRGFINGTPAPLKSLSLLGDELINLHGQHAHQALLSLDHQRELLDGFADLKIDLQQLKQHFTAWSKASQALSHFKKTTAERIERQALLQFQCDELEQLHLIEDEVLSLDEQQKKLSHADSLKDGCEQVISELYENERSVYAQLTQHHQILESLTALDPALGEYAELLNQASIQIEEAGRNLKDHITSIDIDPSLLHQVESRLSQLHDYARKYRCQPEQLNDTFKHIQASLHNLNQQDEELTQRQHQVEKTQQDYQQLAEKISLKRKKTAATLAKTVTKGMSHLNMPDALFDIEVTSQPSFKPHGIDQVNFCVSANKGQPLQPISKVASGGELSRMSLVIQVATSTFVGVPTLIFDEVDVGISGSVAQVVGELLRQLGESKQVLCVTHLPQVASQAHNHYQVSKQTQGNDTQTSIQLLDKPQRIEEIARLLSGKEITENTKQHALEMLNITH